MKETCFEYADFLESNEMYLLAEFSRNVGRYAELHTREEVLSELNAHKAKCFYYEPTISELERRIDRAT